MLVPKDSSSSVEVNPQTFMTQLKSSEGSLSETEDMLEVWHQREALITRIKDNHYKTQKQQLSQIKDSITKEIFDLPIHEKEFNAFLQK